MKKIVALALAACLSASAAFSGGYVAPAAPEPVVVETRPASSNAG